MDSLRAKKGYICDMDGVIYRGDHLLPGVKEFVHWLYRENKKFLFLTNSSRRSPKELQHKLAVMGLEVGEEHFYTSALATAKFIGRQSPGGSAYVIGEPALFQALTEAGITVYAADNADGPGGAAVTAGKINPDYVIVGETDDYNYGNICQAINYVFNGAKLIGTNTDLTAPLEHGIGPACRALLAPIEATTGKYAYYIGKPNPLMMRTGLKILGVHSEEAAMIGDRMDTDIIAGIESGLDSILVLSGVTSPDIMEQYPYRPRLVLEGVGDIPKK